ncbi:hypothetical protein C2S53_001129 [Perilla frutescens var. hirtella]|uniref:Protein kinase domain-containing protein n=1 Tax=Perilla frutescens var. hirtella TaxID=608512 RepID=A0AAD4JLX4_PERFH|nr:hypothetical protein C2S53_001129 [Perilla frutescens var. hirtella]
MYKVNESTAWRANFTVVFDEDANSIRYSYSPTTVKGDASAQKIEWSFLVAEFSKGAVKMCVELEKAQVLHLQRNKGPSFNPLRQNEAQRFVDQPLKQVLCWSHDAGLSKWEKILFPDRSREGYVWLNLKNSIGDAISKVVFDNSHQEDRIIFELLTEEVYPYGHDTFSSWFLWTIVLLSTYSNWLTNTREENLSAILLNHPSTEIKFFITHGLVRAALAINNVTLFHFENEPRVVPFDVIKSLQSEGNLCVMMLTDDDHELSAWRVTNVVGTKEVDCSPKLGDKLYHVTNISRDTSRGVIMYWKKAEIPFEVILKLRALGIASGSIKGYGCPYLSITANVITTVEIVRVYVSCSTFILVHSSLDSYGKQLLDQLARQCLHSLEEDAHIIKELMLVVRYFHKLGVVHPESIWMKCVDFGLVVRILYSQNLNGVIGSPTYVAHELLIGNYSERVAIWSDGVILHVFLVDVLPFEEGNMSMLVRNLHHNFNILVLRTRLLREGSIVMNPEARIREVEEVT